MRHFLHQSDIAEHKHKTQAEYDRILKDYYDNNIKNAIANLTRLVETCKEQEDFTVLARAYNLMGAIYASIGSTALEVDCYLHALDCASEHGMTYMELVCLNNIGSHYQEAYDYEHALAFFKEAYAGMLRPDLIKDEKLDILHIVILENLALSSLKLHKYSAAESYYIRAKTLAERKKKSRVFLDLFLLKCILDWHKGKTQEVWDRLPELEERMKEIWEPADFLEQIEEYILLLKDMEAYDFWKRIVLYAYDKTKQYNSKSRLLSVLELWLDYDRTMKLTDTKEYKDLCSLYVDTSLELKEQNRLDKLQIANVKIQLYEEEKEKLKTLREKMAIQEIAEKDTLTGLGNRYSLRKYGRDLLEKSKEEHTPLVVGLLDVDCIKQYNDTYGHVAGDQCLTMISNAIKSAIRKAVELGACGKAFRYGGDEFLILLTGITKENLDYVAQKISDEIEKLELMNEKSPAGDMVSVSQGYYCRVPDDDDELEDVLKKADIQLYRVKENRRNGYQIMYV